MSMAVYIDKHSIVSIKINRFKPILSSERFVIYATNLFLTQWILS